MTDKSSETAQPYEIESIRRVEPPPGGKGPNWYHYVIAFEGSNTIDGCRQGGLKTVTREVKDIVAQLNERHLGRFNKPRRVHLVLKKTTRK